MEVKETPVQLKNALDLIYHPHPITPVAGRVAKQALVKEGATIREIVYASGIDPLQPIYILLDDRLLTVEEWDSVIPKAGQLVNVQATVQGGGGGGGGSNPLMIVAMVALVVAAIVFQQYYLIGALGQAGAYAATAAIMVVGSAVINSVFAAQMPTAQLADTSGGAYSQPSATYSLAGGSNRQRPYESMPVIMGNHRFYPDLASKPFTEYHGEDQYLYQIFHLGLSSATFTDWTIGTTSINNYQNWAWNFADQNGNIGAFPGNVDSTPGAALENSAGWIVRTTSSNTYRIGLDIEGTLYYANDNGGLSNTSVQLRVEYRALGSSTWIAPSDIEVQGVGFVDGRYENYQAYVSRGYWRYDWYDDGYTETWVDTSYYETRTGFFSGGNVIIINGATQAPRRATLFINPPSVGTYEVRVIRDTGDSSDARLQNKTNWSTLRSYQKDNSSYIGQTRIGLTIRASEQLNGVVQQLSVTANSRASYYNGSAWVFGETSNPAHWFMDFAVGRRDSAGKLLYGIGMPVSQIDVNQLAAWATFCSNEGLTFNAVLDDAKTAAEVLTSIARCGFGSPSWASGKLGVVWDGRNQSPVAAFGMSNILKGSFTVSYITEQLAEEIVVRYVNPAKDWGQDEVRVLVPGITSPQRSSTIDVWGCTSQTMAGKFANYVAAQQYYRRRRITWDCDFEGFVCQRGDVVLLSHDLTQWGYSGRVVSSNGSTITFDREVPRSGLVEHMMLKKPDGTMTTYTVAAGNGNQSTVSLTSHPSFQSGYELLDHIWFFSPLATPGKKVKILSVQPTSETRVQVVATDEEPEFYAAWDGSFQTPPQNTLLLNSVPVVSNIRTTENIYRGTDNSIKSHVGVMWDTNGIWERANIRYRVGNETWTKFTTQATKFEFDTSSFGNIEIEILPITGLKVGSPTLFTGSILGVEAPLPDVTNFLDYYRDGKTVLTWTRITDPRTIDYEIRKGSEWDKAQVLGRVINNEFITDGDGTYWVAAHTGTLYSPNPAFIIIEGASIVDNVVATFDEEATGWSGTLSGGAVIDGTDIILSGTPIPSEGAYEIPSSHIVDIGTAQACNLAVTYRMAADSPFNLVSLIPVFSAIPSLVGKYAGLADVKIQVAIAPDSGVFADWRDFVPGTYFGRKFKFRALLYSYDQDVTPILDKMTFTVDMPDRYETGTDISVTAGGVSITYAKPFQITPNVQVTIVNAVANDDIVVSNESETGFDVKIINGATDVTRNINWIAQGY
jgi:Putative phage tail protein